MPLPRRFRAVHFEEVATDEEVATNLTGLPYSITETTRYATQKTKTPYCRQDETPPKPILC